MAAPAVRTFSVFKDDSPSSSPTKSHLAESEASTPQSPTPALPSLGGLIVFCPDKENIHPFTGQRPTTADSSNKKRKTAGVLATKSLVPSKKQKELKETKNRAPSTSSTVVLAVKGRTSGDKKAKRSITSRRTAAGPSRTRREPSLPPVDEAEESEKEKERVIQAQIDSRCYELTVSPLADVSPAFEQASTPEHKDAVGADKDAGILSSPVTRTPSPSRSIKDGLRSPVFVQAEDALSTPQRKRIYSAFTFSSPSPSSKRFAAGRGSNVELCNMKLVN